MKNFLFIPLLALSGCGISTYLSETINDPVYVPVSIKDQILGYIQGNCADGSMQQRFFIGGTGIIDQSDVYIYQYKLIHNLNGTYALQTRTFKNQIEEATQPIQTGHYIITQESVNLENIGEARADLGQRGSRLNLELGTPSGAKLITLHSWWLKEDITNTPLCP